MSLIALPYIFQPGTTISSSQVNADFAAILNVVNGNLDGSNFSTIFSSLHLVANGHGTLPGGLTFQWGTATNVPFDNSSSPTVSFDINFSNTVYAVIAQVQENTQNNPALVVAFVQSPSLGQFHLSAMGGAAGTTGSVMWFAVGN